MAFPMKKKGAETGLAAAEQRAAARTQHLARLAALRAEVDAIPAQEIDLGQRINAARGWLANAESAIDEHKAEWLRHKGGMPTIPDKLLEAQTAAKTEIDALLGERSALRQSQTAVRAEMERIRREVLELGLGTDAAQVMAQQVKVDEARDQLRRIEALITAQQAVTAQTRAGLPGDSSDFAREDLLAAIAAGTATAQDLNQFDAERAAQRPQIEAAQAALANSEAALAGLERQRTKAGAQLQAMEALARDILRQFMMSEIAAAGDEYLDVARAVHAAGERLRGLKLLTVRLFPEVASGAGAGLHIEMALPAYGLRVAEPDIAFPASGLLFAPSQHKPDPVPVQRARLAALGIALPA
jgi:chromosome segregation ATPase